MRSRLAGKAAEVDAGYPNNADLTIDDQGRPTLKRRKGKQSGQSAFEELVKQRMP